MAVIEVQDLTKIYRTGMRKGDIVAIDNLTLNIGMGEIFGLLGPNGAGKTTLFRVLLSLTAATSGGAKIFGRPSVEARSRSQIGYLPENHRFPFHLTGMGLLEFTARMYGIPPLEFKHRADELLELVGMTKWADTKIRNYSKGMGQRIGLAQAMISDPEVLLLDEPTDGVDPLGKIELRKVLERIRAGGKSIVLNSHLLSEVESVADRVAILSRGRLVRVGTVEELTSRKSQYDIEADMGSRLIEIPEEIGKVVVVTARSMTVELTKKEYINHIIDMLRMKKIPISAVTPVKVSLEQSFLETITSDQENQP
ncbi:MAG: ABC transporter ATP-binding protein [candidate division Zixibacteria bacterium]|nr:ABC transporter ATP-binding protein [candidate division Zixibacteria bacterium]MDH3939075.1 ABC transporter ATP-binding protein [candidate division Zixibacteria bacterium]MDH4032358.1 ABC transporter ATP-binding protein [candidate division Zixibacteria bacterium]